MKTLLYLKALIKDRYVASITPSSRFAVASICKKVDFQRNNLIVEYGPGTGVFTVEILKQMSADSRLIAIERNENFYRTLKNSLQDSRLEIFHDCVANLPQILAGSNGLGVDYVISGIPFSFFPRDFRHLVLSNTHRSLKTGGKFLAYQTFYQPDEHLRAHLETLFPVVHKEYVLLCVPPLLIYEAVKGRCGPAFAS